MRKKRAPKASPPPSPGPIVSRPPGGTHAKPILIVDDDLLVVQSTCDLLASKGYETHGAHDGEEAFRVLESVAPGIILLDLVMPVMNGYDFLRRFWERGDLAAIPVVVISASNVKNPAGPVEFLRKPIDQEALLALARARCGEPGGSVP